MLPRIGSTGSASPQRHVEVEQPLSPARNPAAADMPQQNVPGTPPRGRPVNRSFLENTLGNKDLANLATWLDGVTRNWVLTGSTALKLWGHELNHKKAMDVIPHDADIVVTDVDMMKILDKKREEDRQDKAAMGQDKTFLFNKNLSVDLIASSAKKTAFGDIAQDVKIIRDVQVMSLSTLLTSKKAAMLLAQQDNQTEKYQQGVVHVALLNDLITLQKKQQSSGGSARLPERQQKLIKATGNRSQKMPAKPSGKRALADDRDVTTKESAAPGSATQSTRAATARDRHQTSDTSPSRDKRARKQLSFD
ncbi:MAG: hypothetical protein ACI9ZF_003176 [Bradyrhizobium sp.]|jgi:hypothetical protein